MHQHYDAIVIGGGVMGSASAYHLAKDGLRVLLLEQYAIGHSHGSSHGRSRIYRWTYAQADYVTLARAAGEMWQDLERELAVQQPAQAEPLYIRTGGLEFGAPGTPSLEALRQTLSDQGVAFDWLDQQGIAERFPQFRLPKDTVGLYQAETALLDADRCVSALADGARRFGAVVREAEPVQRIVPRADGVEVECASARFSADRLVIAAGSWMRPLLQQLDLDLPLRVSKEQFLYFEPRDESAYQVGRFPIFVHHDDGEGIAYGFPIYGPPGVKVARPRAGPIITPEQDSSELDPEQLAILRSHVAAILPGLTGTILEAQTCRYTNTPDHDFILDHHPAYPQIVLGSPCSGHGFKFGVLIGRVLADLAQRRASGYPIGRFRLRSWH